MNTYKDWTGNDKSVHVVLGASNHSDGERQEHDYYATDPKAMELLLAEEQFSPTIWEPACGEGHLSKTLEGHGYSVFSTDLIYRGYGDPDPLDFLKATPPLILTAILLQTHHMPMRLSLWSTHWTL